MTIAWGIHDRLLPFRTQAPRARALLPHAKHLTLGVGHVPFYDDPAVVAETIRAGAPSERDRPSRNAGQKDNLFIDFVCVAASDRACGHTARMDSSEARELLAASATRIERALADSRSRRATQKRHTADSGDSAPELVDAEIDEGLAAPLREQLAAIERAEQRLSRRHVRQVGRERRADPGRAAAKHPVGRAHGRGAGALRVRRR